ncbi:MAG: right-handed parallel beta-helix repeat-containing protein [Synergistaceae bacterium]|nr:right-handed parallel beta-helix repeat-containing protein [Synergistaceae bacterium]
MSKFSRFIYFILVFYVAISVSLNVIPSGAHAEVTLYVTVDGAGNMDGTSWENAARDLKGLIDNLNGNADIWVAKGVYSPGTGSEDTFSLKKGLKIYGGFDGTESVLEERDTKKNAVFLDGGKISRKVPVVTARSGATSDDTRLDCITITGGVNITNGGGLFVEINSNPLITECVFTDNMAHIGGGGLYIYYSSPIIQNCTFAGNKTLDENGGGVINYYASPIFGNCVFQNNEAVYGGGLFNYGSITEVVNCTFSDNRSSFRGAGMSNFDSTVVVSGGAFTGNHGEEYGGGMHNEDSRAEIRNCVFSNNRASPGNGGGIASLNSSVEIAECKFTMNEADFYGGGMAGINSSLKISGCVFSENKALRIGGGGMVIWQSTVTIDNSRFFGNTARTGRDIFNRDSFPVIENSVFSGDKIIDLIHDEGENSKTILNNCEISSKR